MHFREILVLESSIPVNGQYVQQFQSTELDLILPRVLITYTTFEIEANTPMMNYIVCWFNFSLTRSTGYPAHRL